MPKSLRQAETTIRLIAKLAARIWIATALCIASGCKSDEPTPAPPPTAPLPDRIIIGLQNLANYTSYVQTTTEYTAKRIFLKRDGRTVYTLETDTQATTVSRVIFENGDPNVSAQITSTITGSQTDSSATVNLDYDLEAEIRLVDGMLYLHVIHANSEPSFGWQIINADNTPELEGAETLDIPTWLDFQRNDRHLVGRMGDWMLTHYPSSESLITPSTEINIQDGTLEDGTPVDVIRFSGEGLASGVANSIPLTANTSDGLAVLQAGIQNPSITFTIDRQDQIRSRIISYNVFIENIDSALIMESEPNARISIILTVNIVESYSNINADIQPIDAPPLSD